MVSNILSKKTLADALGVSPDSLRKALERMGLREVTAQNIFTILEYYSKPVPGRNTETVEAAKKLILSSTQINHTTINNFAEVVPPVPVVPSYVPDMDVVNMDETPDVQPAPMRDAVQIASSDTVVLSLAFAGAFAIAVGITSPMFMAVGIAPALAYILAVFIDISAFIFMCRGRYTYGVIMAVCTALQAAFTVGAFNWVDAEILTICKGFTVAFAIGIVIHGYSSIIATTKK